MRRWSSCSAPPGSWMSDLKPWEDVPICPVMYPYRPPARGMSRCNGPLVPKRAADWNHRAMEDHRLVCCACGEGQVGTDAEVEQAERAQRAWEEEERDRATRQWVGVEVKT